MYCPAWLDYAEWTFIFCGIATFVAMLRSTGGLRRGVLKLSAFLLIATGLVFGATAIFLFNQRAPHITLDGTLSHVGVERMGRSGRSLRTWFWLEQPDALDRAFRLSHQVTLKDGEHAEVIYQDRSNFVFTVRLLDGPDAGIVYHGYNDGFGAPLMSFAALALGMFGVISYINDPQAIPKQRGGAYTPGVDEDSALHL